jgi:hypothetical protein
MPDDFVSAIEDPSGVNRMVEKAMAEANPLPTAEGPPDTIVKLPGGLVREDSVIGYAEVRELTGEHEEALARAVQAIPDNIFHFMNTLLECGVVRFGSEPPKDTKRLLKQALVGDRDAMIIGIRRATYGDTVDIDQWMCPACGGLSDLQVPIADIPIRELAHPRDEVEFEVPMRKGGHANVRLANGGDQLTVFEDRKLTMAERDTVLLSRCVTALVDADGTEHVMAGFGPSMCRNLGAKDRHEILTQLNERQPGPRFGDMKITHDACNKEVDMTIGIGDLFRDLSLA